MRRPSTFKKTDVRCKYCFCSATVAARPIDFPKGMDGLAAPAKKTLGTSGTIWCSAPKFLLGFCSGWDATQPMPRTVLSPPAGGSPIPNIRN